MAEVEFREWTSDGLLRHPSFKGLRDDKAPEEVRLEVADNGIGIADQDLPRLGNPFVQANSSYNRSHAGAGLGLSVVKGLARLHGGTVELTSTVGEGTTVRIVLPLETQSESGGTPQDTPAVSAA